MDIIDRHDLPAKIIVSFDADETETRCQFLHGMYAGSLHCQNCTSHMFMRNRKRLNYYRSTVDLYCKKMLRIEAAEEVEAKEVL